MNSSGLVNSLNNMLKIKDSRIKAIKISSITIHIKIRTKTRPISSSSSSTISNQINNNHLTNSTKISLLSNLTLPKVTTNPNPSNETTSSPPTMLSQDCTSTWLTCSSICTTAREPKNTEITMLMWSQFWMSKSNSKSSTMSRQRLRSIRCRICSPIRLKISLGQSGTNCKKMPRKMRWSKRLRCNPNLPMTQHRVRESSDKHHRPWSKCERRSIVETCRKTSMRFCQLLATTLICSKIILTS